MASDESNASLQDRRVLLGVTGSIAAYKSALLVRQLKTSGADVQVLMTPDAERFITPVTLGTLSEREVLTNIFPDSDSGSEAEDRWTKHVSLGLWADVFLIAPATAQTIAKLAHGFSDSMLTATALSAQCPLLVCPAMDRDMYQHPATQSNLDRLRAYGYRIMPAEHGELASGLVGQGRLPEPESIVDRVVDLIGDDAPEDLSEEDISEEDLSEGPHRGPQDEPSEELPPSEEPPSEEPVSEEPAEQAAEDKPVEPPSPAPSPLDREEEADPSGEQDFPDMPSPEPEPAPPADDASEPSEPDLPEPPEDPFSFPETEFPESPAEDASAEAEESRPADEGTSAEEDPRPSDPGSADKPTGTESAEESPVEPEAPEQEPASEESPLGPFQADEPEKTNQPAPDTPAGDTPVSDEPVGPPEEEPPAEEPTPDRPAAQDTDSLAGMNVLITAGPTHEPIDPVRVVTSRSTGKMGFALAEVAAQRGADVTLVTGPTNLETPPDVERVDVETTKQMLSAVTERRDAELVIMAAAVSDYTPSRTEASKIKKREDDDEEFVLRLRRTPDILKKLGAHKRANQQLVGFALETEEGVKNAREKLEEKNLDWIVLNNPLESGSGFGPTNRVTLLHRDGYKEDLPTMPKIEVAEAILDRVAAVRMRNGNAPS